MGQRFHDAMEWLYKERAFRVVPIKELLEYYEKEWAKQWYAEKRYTVTLKEEREKE